MNSLASATILSVPNLAFPHVLSITVGSPNSDLNCPEDCETHHYAAESAELLEKWSEALKRVSSNPEKFTEIDQKMKVSRGLLADFREFKVQIRNRREKIDCNQTKFQPVFERELYKLNSEGDALKEENWTFRNMWLAKNGALCYFSKKENRELMYYRPKDIRDVKCRRLGDEESCRPFSFEMQLKSEDGLDYAPGVFAAESEEVMEILLGCVEKFQAICKNNGRD